MLDLPILYSKLEFGRIKDRVKGYTSSPLGSELVDRIMPFTEYEILLQELGLVTECKTLLQSDDPCPLDGIKDIRSAIQRASIENNFISALDLRDISSTLRASRLIRQYLEKRRERYPRIAQMASRLFVDRVLEYNIDQAIDEQGRVKDSASKELHDTRRAIIAKTDALRLRLEVLLRGFAREGYAQEEIITTREGRMVIPVKVEHKHHVPGFIHSSSATGATVFIEPTETLEMNNEIRGLHFAEQREVERILRELTLQVHEVNKQLIESLDLLAKIDFGFAKAKLSIELLASEPKVVSGGPLFLSGARHPILLQTHGYDHVVPLEVVLGTDFRTLIITGPNAGGKTVALKTIGLLTLMTLCGLHIPASPDSQIPLLKQIFIDIGDDQSIENDLSSFTSHLLNIKNVVDQAGADSLVLLDEVGAGTDPTEGGAIGAAILMKLNAAGAFTIATTHHGTLKAIAHTTKGFQNAAMEFNETTLRPTYRLRTGIPGASYALQIAEKLGLSHEILSTARTFLGPEKGKLEALLVELGQKSQLIESERRQLKEQNLRLAELINTYESKLTHVEKEIREKKFAALQEAAAIVDKANQLVEKTVREIKESLASREAIKEVRRAIQEQKRDLHGKTVELKGLGTALGLHQNLEEGDRVRLRGHDEIGHLRSRVGTAELATVEIGTVKLQVPWHELEKVAEDKLPLNSASFVQDRELKPRLDIRGMRGDEALSAVDKFLDDATLTPLRTIIIIHGIGTGTLRKVVSEMLKGDPRVKAYRPADWNQGGAGATIVDLN